MSQLTVKHSQLKYLDELLADKVDHSTFEDALYLIKKWQNGDQVFSFNTSGSTGKPKNIEVPRWKMELSAKRTIAALGLSENMTAVLCMSPKFIGGAMMIIRALVAKMNLIIVPPSRHPLENITEPFDFIAMVPMQLTELLKSGSDDQLRLLHKAKHVLLGGAGVSNNLIYQLQPLTTQYWSTYGMTETISHIALRRLNGPTASDHFEILDGIEIKTGSEGQLLIRDKITDDQWLKTNDVVEMVGPKQFRWIGRLDNVINTGGVKVMAETVEEGIEKVIHSVFPNCRYFISGTPGSIYGSVVTLFLEVETEVNPTKLLEKIKKRSPLNKYEFPKKVISLKVFPETASGKIDKQLILKNQK